MSGFQSGELMSAGFRIKSGVSAVRRILGLVARGPELTSLTAIGVLLAHQAAQASVQWVVPADTVARLFDEAMAGDRSDPTEQATQQAETPEGEVEVALNLPRDADIALKGDSATLDKALSLQLEFEEEIGRLQASAKGRAVADQAVESGGSSASDASKGPGAAGGGHVLPDAAGLGNFGDMFKLLALLPLALAGGGGGSGSGSALAPVNNAPVGVADALGATEDTAVTYTAAQLLGNDTDADGNRLSIKSVSAGVGGTVMLNQDGTVTFTPAANFNGVASFSYVATDGVLDTAGTTVTVDVAAVVPTCARQAGAGGAGCRVRRGGGHSAQFPSLWAVGGCGVVCRQQAAVLDPTRFCPWLCDADRHSRVSVQNHQLLRAHTRAVYCLERRHRWY